MNYLISECHIYVFSKFQLFGYQNLISNVRYSGDVQFIA